MPVLDSKREIAGFLVLAGFVTYLAVEVGLLPFDAPLTESLAAVIMFAVVVLWVVDWVAERLL